MIAIEQLPMPAVVQKISALYNLDESSCYPFESVVDGKIVTKWRVVIPMASGKTDAQVNEHVVLSPRDAIVWALSNDHKAEQRPIVIFESREAREAFVTKLGEAFDSLPGRRLPQTRKL